MPALLKFEGSILLVPKFRFLYLCSIISRTSRLIDLNFKSLIKCRYPNVCLHFASNRRIFRVKNTHGEIKTVGKTGHLNVSKFYSLVGVSYIGQNRLA